MYKIYLILIMCLFSIIGCVPKGLVKAQVAEEIKIADKVTGVESLKLADKADFENVMGSGKIEKNKTSTNVGGNMTNDSEVIKNYIKANEELSKKILETQERLSNKNTYTLYGVISSLFLLVGKYEFQIRNINKRLFLSAEKDEELEERMTERLFNIALKNKKEDL